MTMAGTSEGPAADCIENRTFDEIQVGESAELTRRLTMEDIRLFAAMSGDLNPTHLDQDFAKSSSFHAVIAHGMWGGALISALLGTRLPGPGSLYRAPIAFGTILAMLSFYNLAGKGMQQISITYRIY
jgi:phosphate acetyltransferase